MEAYYSLLESYIWLWNKFEFAFYQITLAKEIKMALSQRINMVLSDNKFKKDPQAGKRSSEKYASFKVKDRSVPMEKGQGRKGVEQFVVKMDSNKKGVFGQKGNAKV